MYGELCCPHAQGQSGRESAGATAARRLKFLRLRDSLARPFQWRQEKEIAANHGAKPRTAGRSGDPQGLGPIPTPTNNPDRLARTTPRASERHLGRSSASFDPGRQTHLAYRTAMKGYKVPG